MLEQEEEFFNILPFIHEFITMDELQKVSSEYKTKESIIQKSIHDARSVDNLRPIINEIINLKAWLSNASQSHKIPTYDLKLYIRSLQNLVLQYDEAKAAFIDKKFRFSHTPETDLVDEDDETMSSLGNKGSDSTDVYTATLDETRQKMLILDKASGNIYIRNISDSIICLPKEANINSVTLERCRNTILVLHSDTFLFIDGHVDCLVTGSCQQLRVHNTSNSILDITINSASNRLIIENCNLLQIVRQNPHLTVDDFSRPEQSDDSVNTNQNFHFVSPNRFERIHIYTYINGCKLNETVDRSKISCFIADAMGWCKS